MKLLVLLTGHLTSLFLGYGISVDWINIFICGDNTSAKITDQISTVLCIPKPEDAHLECLLG
jgi:hypothetical protein